MPPTKTAISWKESDLLLSFREYLAWTPIRPGPYQSDVALPYLYPAMQSDAEQWGIRIGDLYLDERIKSYPVVGIFCSGMSVGRFGFGFNRRRYTMFIDAACKVVDVNGAVDRAATELQRDQLFSDLEALLLGEQARSIPFYVFNPDGSKTRIKDSTFGIAHSPAPRFAIDPAKSATLLSLHIDLSLEVFLMQRRRLP